MNEGGVVNVNVMDLTLQERNCVLAGSEVSVVKVSVDARCSDTGYVDVSCEFSGHIVSCKGHSHRSEVSVPVKFVPDLDVGTLSKLALRIYHEEIDKSLPSHLRTSHLAVISNIKNPDGLDDPTMGRTTASAVIFDRVRGGSDE